MTTYTPPKVWTWDAENGGDWAKLNRPIAGATHDKALQPLPNDRHISQHFGADRYCPVRYLVPWQQVAGK